VRANAYYFQDELRFGTRTDLGRRWTACGVRPTGEMLIGYEYGYLSVALNPCSGEMFALILPDMRVESFQVFVDEFSHFVGQETLVRLITDGAGAHRSQRIKLKDSILLEQLPAYSPELNPVERLFKELRQQLKNRLCESLEEVEKAVIEAVKPYLTNRSAVKKLTFYSWMNNALI
jgi:transposase